MNTNFALLARFGSPIIPVEDICIEFFGVQKKTAEQMVKAGTFPVPAFKLREIDNQRSPTMVKIEDLAAHIDKQYKKAKLEWQSVNC